LHPGAKGFCQRHMGKFQCSADNGKQCADCLPGPIRVKIEESAIYAALNNDNYTSRRVHFDKYLQDYCKSTFHYCSENIRSCECFRMFETVNQKQQRLEKEKEEVRQRTTKDGFDLSAFHDSVGDNYQASLYSLIATRSVLLQVFPYFSCISIFAVNTSPSPLFVNSEKLTASLPEFYMTPAESLIESRRLLIIIAKNIFWKVEKLRTKEGRQKLKRPEDIEHLTKILEKENVDGKIGKELHKKMVEKTCCAYVKDVGEVNIGLFAKKHDERKFCTFKRDTLKVYANKASQSGKPEITHRIKYTDAVEVDVENLRIEIDDKFGTNVLTMEFDNEADYKEMKDELENAKAFYLKVFFSDAAKWTDNNLKWVVYLYSFIIYFERSRFLSFLQFALRSALSFGILFVGPSARDAVVIAALIILLPFNVMQMFGIIIQFGRAMDIRYLYGFCDDSEGDEDDD
jgi:hypothetical protein